MDLDIIAKLGDLIAMPFIAIKRPILQGVGGVAPKDGFLQLCPNYVCNIVHLGFAKNSHIRPLSTCKNEFKVTARGSTFHLLIGKHSYGKYLCIPNWKIGTEMSSLSDCFWNSERLEQDYPDLSKVDIISIVKALEALSRYIT